MKTILIIVKKESVDLLVLIFNNALAVDLPFLLQFQPNDGDKHLYKTSL